VGLPIRTMKYNVSCNGERADWRSELAKEKQDEGDQWRGEREREREREGEGERERKTDER